MKKVIKIFSALAMLALFAGCDDVTTKRTSKRDNTTTNPTSSRRTTATNTSSKKTTTQDGDSFTLTVAVDPSADTSSLRNTVKVFNKTANKELHNGDAYNEDDELVVTVFNCASDVKLHIVCGTYEIFPWFGYEKLEGSDVSVGQEEVAFLAYSNARVELLVDDGTEPIEYCKYNITTTATNITTDISVAGMEEDEHKVKDNDTIVKGSSIYYTITNNGSESIIFAFYNDDQFDYSTIIEPGATLDDYDAIVGNIHIYIDAYVEYKAVAGTLPDNTTVSIKNESSQDIANVLKPKFEKINISVTNSTSTNYIAKIMVGDKAIDALMINKNSTVEFDTVILTGNITVEVTNIEGPTITIPSNDKVYIIAGYLLGEEDIALEDGDTIPTGLELSIMVFNTSNPITTVTITITIGGEIAFTSNIPVTPDGSGMLINGIYATGEVVIAIE